MHGADCVKPASIVEAFVQAKVSTATLVKQHWSAMSNSAHYSKKQSSSACLEKEEEGFTA